MFAVIKAGGKQYRVAAEDVIRIDRVKGEPGEIVEFGEVLVLGGDTPQLGMPTIAGRQRCRRGAPAHARRQGDRLQEAPAQEFAPQARLPPGILGDPHHRDPDRRGQALEDGAAAAQARAQAEGRRRRKPRRKPSRPRQGQGRGQEAKAKKPAAKKPAKAKGRPQKARRSEMIPSRNRCIR